jgi:hypothetical protein
MVSAEVSILFLGEWLRDASAFAIGFNACHSIETNAMILPAGTCAD